MKKLGLLALLITTYNSLAFAQINNFFLNEEGKVVWQKIYETNYTYDELYNHVINCGTFEGINGDGTSRITCKIVRGKVDYRNLGFEWGDLPLLVTASDINCFAIIQVKDGRYRVTVDNFSLTENTTRGLFKEGTEDRFEQIAVKKGTFSKSFIGNTSTLYDKYLTNIFTLVDKSYIDDEW